MLMQVEKHVGIDMSKDSFDVAVRSGERYHQAKFDNTIVGFNQFRKWLRKLDIFQPSIWMEATGRYHEALATWATEQGYHVVVANPRAVRRYSQSRQTNHKTDSCDARMIADFGESRLSFVPPWKPLSPVKLELRDIQLEVDGLMKIIGQERNRLKCGLRSATVIDEITDHIACLQDRIKRLRQAAVRLIEGDPELSIIYAQLLSIKGIGSTTAIILIVRIDFNAFQKGRQLVKYAGIDPCEWTSGTSVKKRVHISRQGHSSIRTALYFPALAAMRHDPETIAFAQALLERGRPKKAIICAVMARLLRTAFALVRDGRSYSPQFSRN